MDFDTLKAVFDALYVFGDTSDQKPTYTDAMSIVHRFMIESDTKTLDGRFF